MVQTNNNNSMEVEVEVISRENIKPSSPTPSHLRKLKRSYIDAILNPMYVPIIFFFQPHEPKTTTITFQTLKESLSRALTSFYPLAGRIQDNHIVDCNDSGVEFVEARVHARLKDSMQDPDDDVEALKKYLPSTMVRASSTEDALLLVQLNTFDCGGIALGVLFLHLIADFSSLTAFIKAWAARTTTKSPSEVDDGIISPKFDLANYFPSREFPSSGGSIFDHFLPGENFSTKRLVFDKEKLLALREIHAADHHEEEEEETIRPTRVELVSAFIWKNIMMHTTSSATDEKKAVFTVYHAVNLRPRKSRLFENVFGNCFVLAYAVSDSAEKFPELSRKLRKAIRRIDDDYITEAQSGGIVLNDLHGAFSSIESGETEYLGISSWCGFPIYEVDFGWGNPTWVCTTGAPVKNSVILLDSKCGEGIEAWPNMEQGNLDFIQAKLKLI